MKPSKLLLQEKSKRNVEQVCRTFLIRGSLKNPFEKRTTHLAQIMIQVRQQKPGWAPENSREPWHAGGIFNGAQDWRAILESYYTHFQASQLLSVFIFFGDF